MTPQQCRAARALLGLTRPQLSLLANLGKNTLLNFETRNHRATAKTISKLRGAFESLSVYFVDDGNRIGVQRVIWPMSGGADNSIVDPDSATASVPPLASPGRGEGPGGQLSRFPLVGEVTEMDDGLMTPEQCRAARTFLGLSQSEACALAGVGLSLLVAYETGLRIPRRANALKIRAMYEASGIVFSCIDGAPGVHARVPEFTKPAPECESPMK